MDNTRILTMATKKVLIACVEVISVSVLMVGFLGTVLYFAALAPWSTLGFLLAIMFVIGVLNVAEKIAAKEATKGCY